MSGWRHVFWYPSVMAVFLVITLSPGVVPVCAADPQTALADSLKTTIDSYWGPIATAADSNSAHFTEIPKPAWEKAVLVPYHIAGLPFRALNILGTQTYNGLNKLGILDFKPSRYAGLLMPSGIYVLPSVGAESMEGFSYGLEFNRPEIFGPDNKLFVTVGSSTHHANRVTGGALFYLNDGLELQLGSGYEKKPVARYYGSGPGTSKAARTYYDRTSSWSGLSLEQKLDDSVSCEFKSFYSSVFTKDSRFETEHSLSSSHRFKLPAGFPGSSSGMTYRLAFVRDTTNEKGRPSSGSFQKVSFSYFNSTDDSDLEYFAYRANFEKFIPLWFTQRNLGVRAFINRLDNQSDTPIPLARLLTFSRPDQLRGFSGDRFYGSGTLGINAEYRWPIWVVKGRNESGIDAYVFTDIGQVYDKTSEIAWSNMETSGGFGLRLVNSTGGLVGRLEIGISVEEPVFRLKFSQNFQYLTRGLLNGKDPTRRR